MPVMGGLEAAGEIMKYKLLHLNEHPKTVPVIAMSAYDIEFISAQFEAN